MKRPDSARGAEAFRVTSTATFASPVDATSTLPPTSLTERWFCWCTRSNSVQPLELSKGSDAHD